MRKGSRLDARIRIRKVVGQWYAFANGGVGKRRNLQLFLAIRFCERLNAKATRSAS